MTRFASPAPPVGAAIYARYSSDNQSEQSIEDQVRICRARAEREGWSVVDVYADYAISGASAGRPRFQQLLADARAKRVRPHSCRGAGPDQPRPGAHRRLL